MNNRKINIYHKLIVEEKMISLETLAEEYDVSIRTIQNDIRDLNDKLSDIECETIAIEDNNLRISYREGDVERFNNSISFYDYKLDIKERHCVIILIILLNNSYVTLSSISKFLNYSKTTLVKDFSEICSNLKKLNIELHSEKFRGIFVGKSDEITIRRLIINLINDHPLLIEFGLKELLKTELIDIRLKTILLKDSLFYQVVRKAEKESGFFLTSESSSKIKLYIKIAMSRIMLGHMVDDNNPESANDLPLTESISRELDNYFNKILLEPSNKCLNEMLLGSNYIILGQLPINYQTTKLYWSVRCFLNRLSTDLNFSLEDDFLLYHDISNYLHQSLESNFGKLVNQDFDPLDSGNNTLRFIDRAVNKNIHLIEEISGYKIADYQIKDITYFIQASVLRTENNIINLNYVLVTDKGAGITSYIYEQLKNRLNTNRIDKTISPLLDEYLEYKKPDLIITTEIIGKRNTPKIQISTMLTDEDMQSISHAVRVIKSNTFNRVRDDTVDSKIYSKAKKILLSQQPYGKDNGSTSILDNTYSFSYLLPKSNIKSGILAYDWREAVIKSANILLECGKINMRDLRGMLINLEKDNNFVILNNNLAVIPIISKDKNISNVFAMSLAEFTNEIEFGKDDYLRNIKYVCCVTVDRRRNFLKAIHFITNMLREESYTDN